MARGSKTRYLPFGGSIQLKDTFVKTFTEVLMEMSVEDKIKMKQIVDNIVTGINSNNIEKVFSNLDLFDKYFFVPSCEVCTVTISGNLQLKFSANQPRKSLGILVISVTGIP